MSVRLITISINADEIILVLGNVAVPFRLLAIQSNTRLQLTPSFLEEATKSQKAKPQTPTLLAFP